MLPSIQGLLDPAAAGSAVAFLMDISLKTLLVLAMAGIVTSLARRQSAAARHAIWLAAISGVILLPLLNLALPAWEILPAGAPVLSGVVDLPRETAPSTEAVMRVETGPGISEEGSPADSPAAKPVSGETLPSAGGSANAALPSGAANAAVPSGASANAALPSGAANAAVPGGASANAAVPSAGAAANAEPPTAGSSQGSAQTPPVPGLPENVVLSSISNLGRAVARFHWTILLMGVWLLGFLAVIAHYLVGASGLIILARRSRRVTNPSWLELADEIGDRLWVTRTVRLFKSNATTMPVTWGGFRPVILLPSDADSWSEDRKRYVLTHEFAHIKRWDCTTQAIAQLTCALHWFNPLVWTAARQLRIERERACDDHVILAGGKPSNYAEHLLDIARSLRVTLASPFGAVAMARPSQLEGRVLAILDPERRRKSFSSAHTRLVMGLTLVVILPVAAVAPQGGGGLAAKADPAPALATESTWTDGRVDPTATSKKDPAEGPMVPLLEKEKQMEHAGVWSDRHFKGLAVADTIDGKKAKVVDAFLVALGDEDADIRTHAARALGDLEDPRAIPALMNALENDASSDVRQASLWALSEMGAKEIVPVLVRLSRTATEVDTRRHIAWMLGENARRDDAEAVAALNGLLGDRDPEVRAMAAWSLGELQSIASTQALARALTDESPEVRQKAAWALAELEDPAAVSALTRALDDREPEVRKYAAYALSEIDTPEALRALAKLANDPDNSIRRHAIHALADSDDPAAIAALTAAAKDKDPKIRMAAIASLADREDPQSEKVLISALADPDPQVRRYAAHGLGEISSRSTSRAAAVTALSKMLLDDKEPDNRKAAAHALGEIGSSDAIDALRKAMQDSNTDVRRAATWALGAVDWNDSEDPDPDSDSDSDWDDESSSSSNGGWDVDVQVRTGTGYGVGAAIGTIMGDAAHFALGVAGDALSSIDVDQIVRSINRSIEDADLDGVMAGLAADLADAEAEVRAEINRSLIESLVCVVEENPNSREARQARRALERMKDPQAREALRKLPR